MIRKLSKMIKKSFEKSKMIKKMIEFHKKMIKNHFKNSLKFIQMKKIIKN